MPQPAFFRHPNALVDDGVTVGARTRVWAFAHLVSGCSIGEDCNICDHTFVEGKVKIGNRVTLKCGVYLWDGVEVEDDVFIGPGALFTNDPRPRSKHQPASYPRTLLQQGCSIGAGAIILPGITVGRWAMVGAGAVVTRSVADHALVVGNPARIKGFVCTCGGKLDTQELEYAKCSCGKSFRKTSANCISKM